MDLKCHIFNYKLKKKNKITKRLIVFLCIYIKYGIMKLISLMRIYKNSFNKKKRDIILRKENKRDNGPTFFFLYF